MRIGILRNKYLVILRTKLFSHCRVSNCNDDGEMQIHVSHVDNSNPSTRQIAQRGTKSLPRIFERALVFSFGIHVSILIQ